jgi:hypothetical protein
LFLVVCDAACVFCGLWWPANYVVVGEVITAIRKKEKRKKEEDASVILGC